MAYVLKLTDPEYTDFGYCVNGCIPCGGSKGFFLEDSVFKTEQKAKDYIKVLLDSGWYRPDITEANFEVVEVKQYPEIDPYFYYTKEWADKLKVYGDRVMNNAKDKTLGELTELLRKATASAEDLVAMGESGGGYILPELRATIEKANLMLKELDQNKALQEA